MTAPTTRQITNVVCMVRQSVSSRVTPAGVAPKSVRIAAEAGVAPETITAVADGGDVADARDAAIVAYVRSLTRTGKTDDTTFQGAHDLFGDEVRHRQGETTAVAALVRGLAFCTHAQFNQAGDVCRLHLADACRVCYQLLKGSAARALEGARPLRLAVVES